MNREQKRAYWRRAAKEKTAQMCPYCKHKTIWKFDATDEEGYAAVVICECCENIMFKVPAPKEEEEITSGYIDALTDEEREKEEELQKSSITTVAHN